MFDKITFITYGRASVGNAWQISRTPVVNRVYYIHSGSVVYTSGKTTHTLTEGKLYVFPQNLEFKIITDENTLIDHTFFDFFCVPAIMMDDILEINLKLYPLIKSASDVLIRLAALYSMWSINNRNEFYDLTKSYLSNLLTLINAEFGIGTVSDHDISKSVEYIHNNFQNRITVTELARRCNLEKNVFIRKFKKYTNITPYQYIKNHRINIALSLIRGGDHTLSEIAELTGYSDAAALSHAIKRSEFSKNCE